MPRSKDPSPSATWAPWLIPALIAAVGTIIAALLTSPIVDKFVQELSPQATPSFYNFSACLEECDGTNGRSVFPERTTKIHLRWNYEHVPVGAHYIRTWRQAGREWVKYDCVWPGPEIGTFAVSIFDTQGLPSGMWEMTITVDEQVVFQEKIEIEGNWVQWEPAGTRSTCQSSSS